MYGLYFTEQIFPKFSFNIKLSNYYHNKKIKSNL